ncbi:MAG: hypothetical protein ABJN36_00145 [Cyclobacteriaceae bacterium]
MCKLFATLILLMLLVHIRGEAQSQRLGFLRLEATAIYSFNNPHGLRRYFEAESDQLVSQINGGKPQANFDNGFGPTIRLLYDRNQKWWYGIDYSYYEQIAASKYYSQDFGSINITSRARYISYQFLFRYFFYQEKIDAYTQFGLGGLTTVFDFRRRMVLADENNSVVINKRSRSLGAGSNLSFESGVSHLFTDNLSMSLAGGYRLAAASNTNEKSSFQTVIDYSGLYILASLNLLL